MAKFGPNAGSASVQEAAGSMRLKVWVRMWWNDTRLSWDPNAYNGVTTTQFLGHGEAPGDSIWTPDIQPYNANEGIVHTLEPAFAKVSNKGSVFYSRPGSLDVRLFSPFHSCPPA